MVNKLPVVTREPFRSSNLPEKKKKTCANIPLAGRENRDSQESKRVILTFLQIFHQVSVYEKHLALEEKFAYHKDG